MYLYIFSHVFVLMYRLPQTLILYQNGFLLATLFGKWSLLEIIGKCQAKTSYSNDIVNMWKTNVFIFRNNIRAIPNRFSSTKSAQIIRISVHP